MKKVRLPFLVVLLFVCSLLLLTGCFEKEQPSTTTKTIINTPQTPPSSTTTTTPTPQTPPSTPHTHTYASDWSKDKDYHWHASTCGCANTVSEKSEHHFDSGVITKWPTESEKGEKTFTCEDCNYQKIEEIPKTTVPRLTTTTRPPLSTRPPITPGPPITLSNPISKAK